MEGGFGGEAGVDLEEDGGEREHDAVLEEREHDEVEVGVPLAAVGVEELADGVEVVGDDVAEVAGDLRVVDLEGHVRRLQHEDVVVPVAHRERAATDAAEQLDDVLLGAGSHVVADERARELEDELEVLLQERLLRNAVQRRPVHDHRQRSRRLAPRVAQLRSRLRRLQFALELLLLHGFADLFEHALDLRRRDVLRGEVEVVVVHVLLALDQVQRLRRDETVLEVVARQHVHVDAHLLEVVHARQRVRPQRVPEPHGRLELEFLFEQVGQLFDLRLGLHVRAHRRPVLADRLVGLLAVQVARREDERLQAVPLVVLDDPVVLLLVAVEVDQLAHGVVDAFDVELGGAGVGVLDEDGEPVSF